METVTRRKFLITAAGLAIKAALPTPASTESPEASPALREFIKKFVEIRAPKKEPHPHAKSHQIKEDEPDPSIIYPIAFDKEEKYDIVPAGLCSTTDDGSGEMFACAIKKTPYNSPKLEMQFVAFKFNPDAPRGNQFPIPIESSLKNPSALNCFPLLGPDGKTYVVANYVDEDYKGLLKTQVEVFEVDTSSRRLVTIKPPSFTYPGAFEIISADPEGAYVNPDSSFTIATTSVIRKPNYQPSCLNEIAKYVNGEKKESLTISTDLVSLLKVVPGQDDSGLGVILEQTQDPSFKQVSLFYFKKDLSKKTESVAFKPTYHGEPISIESVVPVFNSVTKTYDIAMLGIIKSLNTSAVLFKDVGIQENTKDFNNDYMLLTNCPEKEGYWSPQLSTDPNSGETLIIAGKQINGEPRFESVILNPRTGESTNVPSPWEFFRTGYIHPHLGQNGMEAVAISNGLKPETGLSEIKGYNSLFINASL